MTDRLPSEVLAEAATGMREEADGIEREWAADPGNAAVAQGVAVLRAAAALLDPFARTAAWKQTVPWPWTFPVEDEEVAALSLARAYLGLTPGTTEAHT